VGLHFARMRRHKCPSVTIRISNECFGSKMILFWLLDNPVASLPGLFDRSGGTSWKSLHFVPGYDRTVPPGQKPCTNHPEVTLSKCPNCRGTSCLAVFLSEGIQKFLYPAELGVGRFQKIGLPNPEFLAPFVGTFEITCGILVILGFVTRLAVIPLFIISSTAILTTKVPTCFYRKVFGPRHTRFASTIACGWVRFFSW
jgi:uncharacterized membrane protein YphA (DoxX/SURF4 family)